MAVPLPRRRFMAALPAVLLPSLGRAAGVDTVLRGTLERAYIGWAEAMKRGDLAAFSRYTSRYRQLCLRNEVVSLGQPWPRAVFKGIVQAPALTGLTCLDAAEHGDTARLVYFGKVDFGLDGATAAENPVVLRFLRESDGWKFDWLQFVNLGKDESSRQSLRSGGRDWLKAPQFALSGTYPTIPKPCREPYQVAGISVIANGCRVSISINAGMHVESIENDSGGRVITGGLQKGPNPIVISPAALPGIAVPSLQIAVLAKNGSASRVLWKWSPPDPPAQWKPRYDTSIFIRSSAAVR